MTKEETDKLFYKSNGPSITQQHPETPITPYEDKIQMMRVPDDESGKTD
jgi:hypothetical protein